MQLEFYSIDSLPPNVETQVCSKCKKELPTESFSNHGGGYKRTECKKCTNKLVKERELLKAVTVPPPKDYKCPICLKSESECAGRGGKKTSTWVLDHNHSNGLFRGWLCHDCNRALGCFGDDSERMQRGINYLLKNSVTHINV